MPAPHVHTDVECNLVLRGSMRNFLSGAYHDTRAGGVAVFWGGVPHWLVDAPPQTRVIWLTIPLTWLIQWELDGPFLQRLLRGEMLGRPAGSDSGLDELLFARWVSDMGGDRTGRGNAAARKTVMLEVEAWFRRLATSAGRGGAGTSRERVGTDAGPDAPGGHVERLAAYMGEHYREDVSVNQIAASAGLHPNYAMQLFKRGCGMTLWEYLTRLRVSHAQRLLLTGREKVSRIALESGFGSPGRFYEAFARVCGCTPRQYRAGMAAVPL